MIAQTARIADYGTPCGLILAVVGASLWAALARGPGRAVGSGCLGVALLSVPLRERRLVAGSARTGVMRQNGLSWAGGGSPCRWTMRRLPVLAPVDVSDFSPMHHWTEQKIRVHVFYCVLALTVAHLMRRQANHAGLHLSVRELLHQLASIQETVLLYPSTGGRPKARRILTEHRHDLAAQLRPDLRHRPLRAAQLGHNHRRPPPKPPTQKAKQAKPIKLIPETRVSPGFTEDVPAFVELESGGPPPVACRVVGVGQLPSHPTKEGDRREQHLPEEGSS